MAAADDMTGALLSGANSHADSTGVAPPRADAWYREHRYRVLALVLVVNFFCSGVVFGFTALKPMLIDSDVFAERCDGSTKAVDPVHPPHAPHALHLSAAPVVFGSVLHSASHDDGVGVGFNPNNGVKTGCTSQVVQIDLIFTVLSSSLNFFSFPFGFLLDRVGPRASSTMGCLLLGACATLFAFSIRWGQGYVTMVAYSVMGIVGCDVIYLSMFKIINLFPPARAGLVTSLFLCTWELSAVVLFAGQFGFYQGGFSLAAEFWFYAGLVSAMALVAWYAMPPVAIERLPEPVADDPTTASVAAVTNGGKKSGANGKAMRAVASETTHLIPETDQKLGVDHATDMDGEVTNTAGNAHDARSRTDVSATANHSVSTAPDDSAAVNSTAVPVADGPDGAAGGDAAPKAGASASVWAEVMSEYAKHRLDLNLCVMWLSTWVIGHYFYISNAYEQYVWLQGGVLSEDENSSALIDRAQDYAAYFAFLFPVVGSIAAPLSGAFMDRYGLGRCLVLMTALEVVFGVCSVIKILPLQFASMVSMLTARAFVWLVFYAFLQGRVSARVYGTIFGIACCVAGVVNLLGFLFTYLSEVTFGFDFLPINLALCGACTLTGLIMSIKYWK